MAESRVRSRIARRGETARRIVTKAIAHQTNLVYLSCEQDKLTKENLLVGISILIWTTCAATCARHTSTEKRHSDEHTDREDLETVRESVGARGSFFGIGGRAGRSGAWREWRRKDHVAELPGSHCCAKPGKYLLRRRSFPSRKASAAATVDVLTRFSNGFRANERAAAHRHVRAPV